MSHYRTISISELTPGSVLAAPVLDERLVKLLDAGSTVDRHVIDRLKAFGITDVVIESSAETIVSPPPKHLLTGDQERLESRPSTKPVEHCSVCGTLIALLPPAPNFNATAWYCTTCGAVYFGSDSGSESRGIFRVDPKVQDPFAAPLASSISPENVQKLVKSLVKDERAESGWRRDKRYIVVVPVIALPLAWDFRIDGKPVQMTTANISLGGAALIHTRFVKADYLALDFSAAGVESLQVVLQVMRVRNVGPVYEVSGGFISRMAQIPQ